jgi:hypothetical protein
MSFCFQARFLSKKGFRTQQGSLVSPTYKLVAGAVLKSPPPPPIARLAIGDFKTKGRKIHYDSSSLVRLHQRSVECELKVSKIYQNEGEPGGDASS